MIIFYFQNWNPIYVKKKFISEEVIPAVLNYFKDKDSEYFLIKLFLM